MIFQQGDSIDWLKVICSFIPYIVTIIFLRIIWGPDVFSKAAWQEEGFSSQSDWYKNSQSFVAKMSRLNVRPIYIILLIVAFIIGFIYL